MTKQLTLKKLFNDNSLIGTFHKPEHTVYHLDEPIKIFKEDGSLLLVLCRGQLDPQLAYNYLLGVHDKVSETGNRGTSSGQNAKSYYKKDGTISNTKKFDKTVYSSIMGYYDRYPRTNYCRKTAFNIYEEETFNKILPSIQAVSEIFKRNAPDRYYIQKAYCDKTQDDFLIKGTVFTTVTLNKNFRTAYHVDAGDLPDGFGCMSYFKSGKFVGGDICFPEYGATIKLRHSDVILFDPHEIHGNTKIIPLSKDYNRITCVHYYRKNMIYCGTSEQELDRAKRNAGDNIIGPVTENLNAKNM